MLFVAGVAIMLGAMITSFVEVFRIDETVVFEHDRVKRLCQADPRPTPAAAMPDRAEERHGP